MVKFPFVLGFNPVIERGWLVRCVEVCSVHCIRCFYWCMTNHSSHRHLIATVVAMICSLYPIIYSYLNIEFLDTLQM